MAYCHVKLDLANDGTWIDAYEHFENDVVLGYVDEVGDPITVPSNAGMYYVSREELAELP